MPELGAVDGYQQVRLINCSVSSPSTGNPPIRPKQLYLSVYTIKEPFVMLRTVVSHLDPLLSRTKESVCYVIVVYQYERCPGHSIIHAKAR